MFYESIFWQIFGYLASVVVVFSLTRTNVRQLWFINAIGCIMTIAYSIPFYENTIPVILMNLGAMVIDIIQLIRLRHIKEAFNLVTATKGSGYYSWYTEKHANDIKQYDPEERYKEAQVSYFYARNDEVAGLVAYNILEEGKAEIVLDYVSPKFRDVRIGTYFFGSENPAFTQLGIKQLVTKTSNPVHVKYLQQIGFNSAENGQWVKSL